MASSDETAARRRVRAAQIAAAGGVGVLLLMPLGLLDALVAIEVPGFGIDYRDIYHVQAQRLAAGQASIHPHWYYPPLAAMLFAPLTLLPPAQALWVWAAVCLAFAGALAWLCQRQLGPLGPRLSWALACALVVSSAPVLHCLKWTQVSLVIVVLSFAALTLRTRGAPWLLGLATAIKVYPLLYLLCSPRRERRRFVTTAVLATLLLGAALPLVVLGPRTTALYALNVLRAASSGMGESQTLGSVLRRWFHAGVDYGDGRGAQPWIFHLPEGVIGALGLTLAAALLALSLWRVPTDREHQPARAALFMTALSCALAPAWHHYFVCVPIVQALALTRVRTPATCALLALSWLLSLGIVFALPSSRMAWPLYSALGGTLVSAIAAWAALRLSLRAAPPARSPDTSRR